MKVFVVKLPQFHRNELYQTLWMCFSYIFIALDINKYILYKCMYSGFGGHCWPLVPEFAGSNPAEAGGFFGCPNNPQHAFLRRGSERICPMSQLCGM